MDEETPPLHGRPDLEQFRDLRGLDYSPSPGMCRSRRSMKRDESKETYKLPHRLIEKKRRDRINECIAQLKDLLPEHLKLTTLGHLEKAVVLELTLKHVKTLTALTEQQHQKIIALQNGDRSPKSPPQSDLEAFHSGFQTCTKEVLHYLSRSESWTSREQRCVQLLGHLHSVCTRFLPGSALLIPKLCGAQGRCSSWEGRQQQQEEQHPGGILKQEPPQPHCVPVIQRTQNWEGKNPISASCFAEVLWEASFATGVSNLGHVKPGGLQLPEFPSQQSFTSLSKRFTESACHPQQSGSSFY